MTGLSAFTPKTQTIEIPGGQAVVRGLALEDFAVLMRDHHAPMAALFDRYVGEASLERLDAESGAGLGLADMGSVILEAFEYAPALIGDVIARATGETENPHMARLLPVGVQINAVGEIVRLTLEAEGGLEKLVGTISMLAASLKTAVGDRSR
jgi:hypothetical protein